MPTPRTTDPRPVADTPCIADYNRECYCPDCVDGILSDTWQAWYHASRWADVLTEWYDRLAERAETNGDHAAAARYDALAAAQQRAA